MLLAPSLLSLPSYHTTLNVEHETPHCIQLILIFCVPPDKAPTTFNSTQFKKFFGGAHSGMAMRLNRKWREHTQSHLVYSELNSPNFLSVFLFELSRSSIASVQGRRTIVSQSCAGRALLPFAPAPLHKISPKAKNGEDEKPFLSVPFSCATQLFIC